MREAISNLMQRRYAAVVTLLVVVGVSWCAVSAWRKYTICGQINVLSHSLEELNNNDGRFTYDLVGQLDMIERLKQEGAAVETAECLGRLHLNPNPLCRGSAMLLLRELNEAATIALPILEQAASNDALDENIRNDSSRTVEMILEMFCERLRKPMTRPTSTITDESKEARE